MSFKRYISSQYLHFMEKSHVSYCPRHRAITKPLGIHLCALINATHNMSWQTMADGGDGAGDGNDGGAGAGDDGGAGAGDDGGAGAGDDGGAGAGDDGGAGAGDDGGAGDGDDGGGDGGGN
jgi:hypothetical protein